MRDNGACQKTFIFHRFSNFDQVGAAYAISPLAMTFLQRIHQVASQDGVEAVLALRLDNEDVYAGEEPYQALARQAAAIQKVAPDAMVRVNAGTHAIFSSGDGEVTVTLIFQKAHPVVKSVKRTMRQLIRKAQRERTRARRLHYRQPVQPTAAQAVGF